jgi:hypothetical protein
MTQEVIALILVTGAAVYLVYRVVKKSVKKKSHGKDCDC